MLIFRCYKPILRAASTLHAIHLCDQRVLRWKCRASMTASIDVTRVWQFNGGSNYSHLCLFFPSLSSPYYLPLFCPCSLFTLDEWFQRATKTACNEVVSIVAEARTWRLLRRHTQMHCYVQLLSQWKIFRLGRCIWVVTVNFRASNDEPHDTMSSLDVCNTVCFHVALINSSSWTIVFIVEVEEQLGFLFYLFIHSLI